MEMRDNKLGEIISKSLQTACHLELRLFSLSSWLELLGTFSHNISFILSLQVDLLSVSYLFLLQFLYKHGFTWSNSQKRTWNYSRIGKSGKEISPWRRNTVLNQKSNIFQIQAIKLRRKSNDAKKYDGKSFWNIILFVYFVYCFKYFIFWGKIFHKTNWGFDFLSDSSFLSVYLAFLSIPLYFWKQIQISEKAIKRHITKIPAANANFARFSIIYSLD